MPSQPAALTSHMHDYNTLMSTITVSKGCVNLARLVSLRKEWRRKSREIDMIFTQPLRMILLIPVITPSGSAAAAPVDAVQWPFKPITVKTKIVAL